jgi:hypothetical protein
LYYPLLKVQGIYADLMNLSTLFLPEDFTKALQRFYYCFEYSECQKNVPIEMFREADRGQIYLF